MAGSDWDHKKRDLRNCCSQNPLTWVWEEERACLSVLESHSEGQKKVLKVVGQKGKSMNGKASLSMYNHPWTQSQPTTARSAPARQEILTLNDSQQCHWAKSYLGLGFKGKKGKRWISLPLTTYLEQLNLENPSILYLGLRVFVQKWNKISTKLPMLGRFFSQLRDKAIAFLRSIPGFPCLPTAKLRK